MARSLDELYAEIARLPAAERLRLAARLLNDLAAETPASESSSVPGSRLAGSRSKSPGSEAKTNLKPANLELRNGAHRSPEPRADRAPLRFIVVDGSNLLGRLPGFELSSAASRDRLALRLQDYAHAHPTARITLYFDGQQASTSRRGGIEIRYSPRTYPADHFIAEYLKRLTPEQRAHALLVTGDHELADAGRALGVAIEEPERFHRRISGPPAAPRDRGLSKAEVAEWEEYFRGPREEL